jgi:hypothetical protein
LASADKKARIARQSKSINSSSAKGNDEDKKMVNGKRIKAVITIPYRLAQKLGVNLMYAGQGDFEGIILQETPDAILFERESHPAVWLPKSEIESIVYRKRWEGTELVKDYF